MTTLGGPVYQFIYKLKNTLSDRKRRGQKDTGIRRRSISNINVFIKLTLRSIFFFVQRHLVSVLLSIVKELYTVQF